MNITETKLELIEWMLHLNENGIERLLALKNDIENGILAYDADRNSLTLEKYSAKADRGIKYTPYGSFLSHEDLLKNVGN